MSFFDDFSAVINGGAAIAQRAGRTAQVRFQLADLLRQRRELAAQLGASLYDTVKDDPKLREGRELIFDNIASIDEQRAVLEKELEQIEAESDTQEEPPAFYKCPNCGSIVMADYIFCSGCGMPIADIKVAYEAAQASESASEPEPEPVPTCPACGFVVGAADLYCMNCGAKLENANPSAYVPPEPVQAPEPPLAYTFPEDKPEIK